MRQWMMRITSYADRLIDDLDLLDWTDSIKSMQRNWIGRSHGANVHFESPAGELTVFTTRPDTLFGATFMVLAPEHPFVDTLTTAEQTEIVAEYRRTAAGTNEIDRTDDTREKTGVFTGSYAVNPLSGAEIPIWIADYVLMGYGTGAIMAVPCGDQRDFEFARKFGLEIPAIQRPPVAWLEDQGVDPHSDAALDTSQWQIAFIGDAPYVNSSNDTLDLNSIDNNAEGIRVTNEWLEANGKGEPTITYKLRDWLFSRQRYWGEPFPIVYDVDGNPHTLPDDMLPVELPETDNFSPRTFEADDEFSNPESPLDRLDEWVNVTLDLGDGPQPYRRDTNVMPQWAGSCWYQLRYCDPTNENAFVDPEVEQYWTGPRTDKRPDHPGGVDLYVGGVEHAVLHLLYARFWHKVLYDLGHVSSKEPYARLFNQGYIQAAAYKDEREIYVEATAIERRDGEFFYEGRPVTREFGKMGKSLKNAVSPDEMYDEYGADTLRLYEMATGPMDASRPWETRDVVGMYRFLQRLWRNMVDEDSGECVVADTAGRRRHHEAAAPHDRRRAHRDGRAALQHGDRQADRAQQCGHQARCHAARDRRADGADGGPAGTAHGRGTVAQAGPRRHPDLSRLPGRRPAVARRRHDRVSRPGQRQGSQPRHGGHRCRRRHGRGSGDGRRQGDRGDRRQAAQEGHRGARSDGQRRRLRIRPRQKSQQGIWSLDRPRPTLPHSIQIHEVQIGDADP